MLVELVEGPNPWFDELRPHPHHACYFCHPEEYPPMPEGHTICSRCGHLVRCDADQLSERMIVCPPCDAEMLAEVEAASAALPGTDKEN